MVLGVPLFKPIRVFGLTDLLYICSKVLFLACSNEVLE